jgi:hypothetical protein
MGHEYNEQVFPVHTPSFLHGAMVVGAESHYGHKEYMNFLRISPNYPPSSAFAFISFPVFFTLGKFTNQNFIFPPAFHASVFHPSSE